MTLTGAGYSGTARPPRRHDATRTAQPPGRPSRSRSPAAACSLANSGNGALTIAGVTNPPAQTITAANWTVATSTDTDAGDPRGQRHDRGGDVADRGHLRRLAADRRRPLDLDDRLHHQRNRRAPRRRHDHRRLLRPLLDPGQPDDHADRRLHELLATATIDQHDRARPRLNSGPTVMITLANNGGTCAARQQQRAARSRSPGSSTSSPRRSSPPTSPCRRAPTRSRESRRQRRHRRRDHPDRQRAGFAGSSQTEAPARPGRSASPPAPPAGSRSATRSRSASPPASPSRPTRPITLTGAGYTGNCSNPSSTTTNTSSTTIGPPLTVTIPARLHAHCGPVRRADRRRRHQPARQLRTRRTTGRSPRVPTRPPRARRRHHRQRRDDAERGHLRRHAADRLRALHLERRLHQHHRTPER